MEIKQGDKVRLTEKVRHEEYRGLTGTVKKVVKSRNVVAVLCNNGKRYEAFPVADISPNIDIFIAYDANCDHICIGRKAWLYRSPEGNLRMPARHGAGMEITHWMPLPKRPLAKLIKETV